MKGIAGKTCNASGCIMIATAFSVLILFSVVGSLSQEATDSLSQEATEPTASDATRTSDDIRGRMLTREEYEDYEFEPIPEWMQERSRARREKVLSSKSNVYGFFMFLEDIYGGGRLGFMCYLDCRIPMEDAMNIFPAIEEYARAGDFEVGVEYPVTKELIETVTSGIGSSSGPTPLDSYSSPDRMYVNDGHQGSVAWSASRIPYWRRGWADTKVWTTQPLPEPNNAWGVVRMYKDFSVGQSGGWNFKLYYWLDAHSEHTSFDYAHFVTGIRVTNVCGVSYRYYNRDFYGNYYMQLGPCNLQAGTTYEFAYLNDVNSKGYQGNPANAQAWVDTEWHLLYVYQ